jgi:protein-disulfide isomerase
MGSRLGRLLLLPFVLVALAAPGFSLQVDGPAGYAQGPETAPITIQVFSSPTCSACAKLHLDTLTALRQGLVAEGRVRLVHCLIPSTQDPLSMLAARCVHAARRLGHFDDVTAALYSSQGRWMRDHDLKAVLAQVLTPGELKELSGLVESSELEGQLQAEIEAGRRAGVRATPTLVVLHDGKMTPIVGAVSYGLLSRYLERLLEGS